MPPHPRESPPIEIDAVHELNLEAARKAGQAIVALRAEGFSVSLKGKRDLLTTADLEAERIITAAIRAAFPEHKILAEESRTEFRGGSDYLAPLWIIDPVDGTTNYAHGHHQVGVSIAFARGGVLQSGVVYSPFQQELFAAVKGRGATLNGEPISVSSAAALEDALIATGFPYDRSNFAPITDRLLKVLPRCRDLRRLGAASLDICWVACGRIDGFYETLNTWDIAAGRLIAAEAGAVVGNFSAPSEQFRECPELNPIDFICSAPGIHEELKALIR